MTTHIKVTFDWIDLTLDFTYPEGGGLSVSEGLWNNFNIHLSLIRMPASYTLYAILPKDTGVWFDKCSSSFKRPTREIYFWELTIKRTERISYQPISLQ